MASFQHQRIAGVITRAMRIKGYTIVSFEGNESIVSSISLNATPKINRHKPDVIGVNIDRGNICIGEAKTSNDLMTKRTKEQFIDFSTIPLNNNGYCELIIGVPQESKQLLNDVLKECNLLGKNNISTVFVPGVLLYDKTADEF